MLISVIRRPPWTLRWYSLVEFTKKQDTQTLIKGGVSLSTDPIWPFTIGWLLFTSSYPLQETEMLSLWRNTAGFTWFTGPGPLADMDSVVFYLGRLVFSVMFPRPLIYRKSWRRVFASGFGHTICICLLTDDFIFKFILGLRGLY